MIGERFFPFSETTPLRGDRRVERVDGPPSGRSSRLGSFLRPGRSIRRYGIGQGVRLDRIEGFGSCASMFAMDLARVGHALSRVRAPVRTVCPVRSARRAKVRADGPACRTCKICPRVTVDRLVRRWIREVPARTRQSFGMRSGMRFGMAERCEEYAGSRIRRGVRRGLAVETSTLTPFRHPLDTLSAPCPQMTKPRLVFA
jgi:hypothetical protein